MNESIFAVTCYDTLTTSSYFIGVYTYLEDALKAVENHKHELSDYVNFIKETETDAYAKDENGTEYFWNVEEIVTNLKPFPVIDLH